jgi:hypothetical protein
MEQISRPELDHLVDLFDLMENSRDFSDEGDRIADETAKKYHLEVARLHAAKQSTLDIQQFTGYIADLCKRAIRDQKKNSYRKRG